MATPDEVLSSGEACRTCGHSMSAHHEDHNRLCFVCDVLRLSIGLPSGPCLTQEELDALHPGTEPPG